MKTVLYTLSTLSLVFSGLIGCSVSINQKSTIGIPLDHKEVARIQRGVTTLKEVLAWFGPPDFIIDGTQHIPNARTMGAAYSANPVGMYLFGIDPIKPRLLTSPEGTVILIYTSVDVSNRADVVLAVGGGGQKAGENEVFIFVSKDTLIVMDVALGNPP